MSVMAGQAVRVDPGYDTKQYRENAQGVMGGQIQQKVDQGYDTKKMAQIETAMKTGPVVAERREEVVIGKSPNGYDQPKKIEGAMVIKSDPKAEFQKKLASATSQADVLVKVQSIITDPKEDPQVKELAVNFLSGAQENAQKVVADPNADPQVKAVATDFLNSSASAPAQASTAPAPAPAPDSSMWIIALVLGLLAFVAVFFLLMRRRGLRH